ncbi:MAG: hypothetical protein SGPRY_003823 [Prymnesium sp.]
MRMSSRYSSGKPATSCTSWQKHLLRPCHILAHATHPMYSMGKQLTEAEALHLGAPALFFSILWPLMNGCVA